LRLKIPLPVAKLFRYSKLAQSMRRKSIAPDQKLSEEIPMEYGTTLTQKKLDLKLSFRFDEDKLIRTIADFSGESQISVCYEKIDLENKTILTTKSRKTYLRTLQANFLLMAICFALYGSHTISSSKLFYSLLSIFLFILYISNFQKVFSIKYSTFLIPSQPKSLGIRVLHDEKYDMIVDEICKGWKRRVRKLYYDASSELPPANQLHRLKWLLEKQVIDEQEYQDSVTKISGLNDRSDRDEAEVALSHTHLH